MSRPVRLGLAGCGRLAELGYLPALSGLDALSLVAVADPDEGRARLVSERAGTGPATFASAAALLDAVPVDVLLVASPAAAHVGDAQAAAAHGVRVLLEKPPAPTLDEARPLAALAPAPWVGFNRRFDPDAQALRDRLPSDLELDVRVRLQYRRGGWAPVATADDALLDLGPHLVDWVRWLTGQEVRTVLESRLTQTSAVVDLALTRGRARVEAATDRPHEELIEVRDLDGRALGRHRVGGPVAGVAARLRRTGPSRLVTTLRAELAELARAVVAPEHPTGLATVADGLAAMAVLDAARHAPTVPVAVP